MSFIADIASPSRVKRPGTAFLVAPLLILAVWLVLAPHHAVPHMHATTGLAAPR